MVVPSALSLQTYNGGQMTDLPEYDGDFDPTALIEIVAPGNVEEGINYSLTLAVLASYIIASITSPTIITEGATSGDIYDAASDDYRILLNKTVPSDSYVDIGGGADRVSPVMVKDMAGNAATYNITVSFTGTCDGNASPIVISADYGGWVFNPLTDGNWYLTTC
jgi:hypothetical protein